MKLTTKLKKEIHLHAAEMYPRECCGVIVNNEYIRCRNISAEQDQFEIDPVDLAASEDQGLIQAYVHSHPDASAKASELDLIQIELHDKPWVICAYPDIEFQVYAPSGYQVPLIGRNYHHGWQDCYSLVRDFYQREQGIQLPDFERLDLWWESKDHASLYLDNFEKAGFSEVSELQYGDVLICRVGRTEHPNHAVIWLGDRGQLKSEQSEACIGSALILHHPYGRKSVREIFGQQWQERVVKIVRHRDVKDN
ncbi:C40 family peptidase [Acinetobacter colistiniresistens]|uniref:Phage tail protein n=1 Tax=Acinetobacter colistiniresistens TaxID=280145 RepID=A0A558F0A6_9GAMM|nr:Mov34/MPN/PAD-1 family protein [Acinetobacter colistiniresistens]TVT78619.1 phage tail protein [Acinetobacter colistiniresistens]